MTKKEFCLKNPVVAYASVCGGFEIHGIEYGIDDYLYAVSNAWSGKPAYHKLKIQYGQNDSYVSLHGYRIKMSDCIRA